MFTVYKRKTYGKLLGKFITEHEAIKAICESAKAESKKKGFAWKHPAGGYVLPHYTVFDSNDKGHSSIYAIVFAGDRGNGGLVTYGTDNGSYELRRWSTCYNQYIYLDLEGNYLS